MSKFKPSFPVGQFDNAKAVEFMQLSPVVRSFVPFMVLIDRAGIIQAQHTGSEQDYFSEDVVRQSANIRADIEKLLGPPKPAPRRKSAPR